MIPQSPYADAIEQATLAAQAGHTPTISADGAVMVVDAHGVAHRVAGAVCSCHERECWHVFAARNYMRERLVETPRGQQ